MHAQHAEGKRVIDGHGAESHEGHHRWQIGFLGQLYGQPAAPEWTTPPPR